jgi:hypothetical protein
MDAWRISFMSRCVERWRPAVIISVIWVTSPPAIALKALPIPPSRPREYTLLPTSRSPAR